jgi:phosphoribosylformimino-5-aminoimidazole carboxamide ribotide isomerase
MDVIPAIDIRGGRCVRLVQGDYARETVFGDDPVAMALHWASLGARRLHVVDLDGAKERRPVNDALVRRIIDECGVPVQVSGGMGDARTVDGWVEAGAARVVVGTLAVEEPEAVEGAVRRHGERIALAIDAREGKAAVKGWLETSDTPVEEFIRGMAARGVRHFIYTDISRDGMMASADLSPVGRLAALVRDACGTPAGETSPLVFGGGITTVDDIVALAEHDIEGVIVGRALYEGSIDLQAAQRALAVGDDW